MEPQGPTDTAEDPPNYVRPSEKFLLRVYTFDLLGPYPFFISAATAGIHQAENTPSDWGQGFDGYASRFGSGFGIASIDTTARYVLAKSVGEDTLYYQCQCEGFKRRLRHAFISSVTGRRGIYGKRVLSFPSLAAPYAGAFAATFLWYPKTYGAGDAFRMGSYGLLGYIGGNISLEFIYGGPHSLLAKAHISLPGDNPSQDPKQ